MRFKVIITSQLLESERYAINVLIKRDIYKTDKKKIPLILLITPGHTRTLQLFIQLQFANQIAQG